MEYVLCITTSSYPGFACFEGDRLLFQWQSQSARSQELLPQLDRSLKKAGIGIGQMGTVIVDIGPGSFTGLRIGLSAVKAWGFAFKGMRVFAASCLDVVAREVLSVDDREAVAVVKDAGRGNMYVGEYRKIGDRIQKDYRLRKKEQLEDIKQKVRVVDFSPPSPDKFKLPEDWLEKVDVFELRPLYLYPDDCSVSKK